MMLRRGTVIAAASLAAGLALLACSDSSGTSSDAGAGAASRTLHLPMVARTRGQLTNIATELETDATGTKLVLRETVVLGIGEGYPSEWLGELQATALSACARPAGALSYARVDGSTDAIAAELREWSLRIAVHARGTADLIVTGQYTPAPDEERPSLSGPTGPIPMELRVHVIAEPIEHSAVRAPSACEAERAPTVAIASTPGFSVEALDATGQALWLSNADGQHQVAVTLEADDEVHWTPLDASEGLSAVRFPDVATHVQITAQGSEPMTVRVVDAESVTDLDVVFALVGAAAGPVELEDGAMVTAGSRASNRLCPTIPAAYVGEQRLCSAVDPAWFQLHSETPELCEVRPLAEDTLDGLIVSDHVGLSAYVRGDGECRLRLRGDALDDGRGIERALSVTLLDTHVLFDVP